MQAHLPPTLLTGFQPDWTSVFIHQGVLTETSARWVFVCIRSGLYEHHVREGIGLLSCIRLYCLVNLLATFPPPIRKLVRHWHDQSELISGCTNAESRSSMVKDDMGWCDSCRSGVEWPWCTTLAVEQPWFICLDKFFEVWYSKDLDLIGGCPDAECWSSHDICWHAVISLWWKNHCFATLAVESHDLYILVNSLKRHSKDQWL